jgi:isopenicillin-N N-acyltransferase-like protein
MYGAWGAATASTGKTFQLRALDWDIDGPFKNYAAVVVYHPSGNSSGHAFANVGFVGWIGALSGQSSAQMAISEIGVYFSDASFGNESRSGIPFTFLLRDILQVCQDLSCALVFAVGLIVLVCPAFGFHCVHRKGLWCPCYSL